MTVVWYLYIHVTNFVHYHPLAFATIAVGVFALLHYTEKSLRESR